MAFKMKDSREFPSRTLFTLCVLLGLVISLAAEKDFEFTDSLQDDEDFLHDEAGSGSGDGLVTTGPGQSDLFRATFNFSELQYTAEMSTAGRNFLSVLLIRQIQDAIDKYLRVLPGQIKVRVVELRQGSLMVTFDISTDGTLTETEVRQLLEKAIATGQIPPFRVSPTGYEFRSIGDQYVCSRFVGRKPESLPGAGENGANLMINNAFPCDGFVRGWSYYRIRRFGIGYVGVFRQVSDTEFMLVDKTELPEADIGVQNVTLTTPMLTRAGDFIGIFYPRRTRENVVSKATLQDNVVPPAELYQTYYVDMNDIDLKNEVPFSINNFVHSESSAVFGIHAVMDYTNVPVVTLPPRLACTADQFTCKNLDCVDGRYRCDGQYDCYDGSDEENCPTVECLSDEFRCANQRECVSKAFRCNGVLDCEDGSDESSCGIAPVTILSFRDGSESTSYPLLWLSQQPSGIQIVRYIIQYREVSVRAEKTSDGNYQVSQGLSPFTEVTLPSNADRYTLTGLQPGRYYETVLNAYEGADKSSKQSFVFRTADATACSAGEFQCNSGECLDLSRRCDGFPDCRDQSDEDCVIPTLCSEGQVSCKDRFGNIRCISPDQWDPTICVSECQQNEFRCRDGQCIPETQRCDRLNQCADSSDEANCTVSCPANNFQCRRSSILECVDNKLRCDGTPDCSDGSDEEGCPCAPGLFRCNDGNCVPNSLRCDGVPQCEDGSDEFECACPSSDFQCSNFQCIDLPMRCDGFPDCVDGSDEIGCPRCRADQFQCSDGNCVQADMKCDGIPQCEDRSDEQNCPNCPLGDFQCAATDRLECVDSRLQCDGVRDCSDGSDEAGCPCRIDQFTCTDGSCVQGNMKCDGIPQCEDRSDEQGCRFQCASNEFKCATVDECIADSFQCDGSVDCPDRSDEVNCVCTETQFRCGDGICIDERRRCDQRVDCNDRSDELACPCRSGQFQCRNGDCIPDSFACNGQAECEDGSDELNCPCRSGQFQCRNGDCIPDSFACNGQAECEDGSDELNCRCRDGEFRCGSGECIDERLRCDQNRDCRDASDESTCPTEPPKSVDITPRVVEVTEGDKAMLICSYSGFPPGTPFEWSRVGQPLPVGVSTDRRGNTLIFPIASREHAGDYVCTVQGLQATGRLIVIRSFRCSSQEFQCMSDRSCIDARLKCNGRRECADGSDEKNCQVVPPKSVEISPRTLDIREGAKAVLVCTQQGFPPGTPFEWSRARSELPLQSDVDRRGGTLMIPVGKVEDSGDYICSVDGYEAISRLNVVRIGPDPDRPDGPCNRDEAVCRSGQCIRREYRCDGEKDCLDGSDEMDCFNGTICEPNEFQCPSGQCMMKIWRCDGEDDCNDGFDEQNCRQRGPNEACAPDEFQCVSGDQCIPLAYQCDKEIDCQDRSDEIGCAAPVIIVPPVAEVEVEIGGSFTIICEAVGVPTPLIIWRLNWGNIQYDDRMTVTNEEGRGTLTITGARYTDAGAYTCEAINNRGSIFAIPDAIVIVRRIKGPCSPPQFNNGAVSADQCLRCFCFGQSVQCFSSNLQVSRINLASSLQLVDRDSSEPVEQTFVEFLPSTREYQVQDIFNVLRSGDYYWSLPREFLGERLSSYGGELKYTIYYDVRGRPNFIQGQPDIILMGNGITLYYRSRTVPSPGIPTSISVPLTPDAWQKYEGPRRGDTPISEYASREDLMMVLENLESVFIRGIYDNRQTITRIGGILMTTAVDYPTDQGQAYLVEECTCPTGYTGLSCQDCAAGFSRVQNGNYLGDCVACFCNGHSNDCDDRNGRCLNCLHNTQGERCEVCRDGFYGNPRRGTANDCQPCPCPLTSRSNQFSRTCYLDTDQNVTCTNCPESYEGRRCERCAEGYVGNPMSPGSTCKRVPVDDYCDPRGSLSTRPDPISRICRCKNNVEGTRCDSCKLNSFYLNDQYPDGCINCFCMGVSRTCQSTTWNRASVSASFNRDDQGITLTDMMGRPVENARFNIDRQNLELVLPDFPSLSRDTFFWSLPSRFLGDKVMAYGGSLRFELRYRPRFGESAADRNEPLVKISGNDITLVYRTRTTIRPNQRTAFNVVFFEPNWYRSDGEEATREHLMMVLADLDSVLIRATFDQDQQEGGIRDISLDIGEDRLTGRDRAYAVEQCVCPVGYRGLSCEDCDTGYTRSGSGLYLGLCSPCQCSGHSSECDPETGVCRNCQHNTEGDSCEICRAGYYGNARRGTRNDCQKCPCPLTESPNQFSPTCILATDELPTCTACPVGHTGRRCESCLIGYSGNPLRRGDYCKISNITCDCDRRGAVANTQCDASSQQCRCKAYVQGRRCERCQEGYFYLSEENSQGCLSCYCSGITDQCSSSSYYRDVIRPQFGRDGSHNFVLMNRRMNNIISDGFVVDASRNQISFNRFEGVQNERESLLFQLPAKFRGDKVMSYGGYLKFTMEYSADDSRGNGFRDVDIELIGQDQQRLYYLLQPSVQQDKVQSYEILLREESFRDLTANSAATRETFMMVLSDLTAVLIRATYHTHMTSVTLRDVSMDIAVPSPTNLGSAPMVESCRCPQGYTGLSCQKCAPGYLRVSDSGSSLGRCVRCSCNGHASSCDADTGKCLSCLHNTEGDRCERCVAGFYGDATSGTPNDCRQCSCPLSIPSNQFSRTCFLADDGDVTCDRCPTGYTGRDCGTCASGYVGNPREPGSTCRPQEDDQRPNVTVSPVRVEEPTGSTVVFRCSVSGQGPFNVVWSRLDSRPLPSDRFTVSPRYELTVRELRRDDNGRYVCTATNAYGVTRGYVDLRVVSGPRPIRVQVDQTRLEVEEGGTARLVCTVVGSQRDAIYILSWSKQGENMPNQAIDQNGVLIIRNIQASDAGNYVCTGSDMFSTETVTAYISVTSSELAPSIRIEPRYQTVEEGSLVRFECRATGTPRPTVDWYRGGDRALNPESTFTQDGIFQISSARSSDEGDYYCKATNDVGSSEMRTILYVTRKETKPDITIIVRQTSVVALIGSTARLECYVEDETGRVTLFWSRSGGLPPGSDQENGVLTIADVQPSYAGNYICTGTTDTGRTGTAVTRLEVDVSPVTVVPTVRVEPEKLTVPMGTTGTLRCIVTGVPAPTVTWARSRQDLSDNHQVQGDILRISQATMDDRGIYVCRAENVAGSDQDWAVVEVERRMRPKIDLYPQGTQTIAVGASALFQCRVMDGDPPPQITWSRVGGAVMTERIELMDNGVIMFKSATQEEQGSYICTATNDMGTITATATLIVQGPPTIVIQPSKTVYAIVGQRVRLECTAEGEPTPSVYWIDPSIPRRGDIVPDGLSGIPSEDGTAILDIASVRRENSGYYTCVAENSGGRREERVQVVVEEGERAGVRIGGPGTLSVVEGQRVELTCSASAVLNPIIRWRRREGPLPPGHSQRAGVLTIPQLTSEYAGEYICSTNTQQGSYQASVFIIITVAPRLTVSPSRLVARAGETIILRCSPAGTGPFNIEWSKANGLLSPRASENEGILEIQQVTAADAGQYRCVATSSSGSSEGYAFVEITVPPSVRMFQRDYTARVNTVVELRCEVTGYPEPVVRWDRDSGELPAQHRVQGGVLTIYNVQQVDGGRYICTANNAAGTARDYVILRVSGGPLINGGGDTRIDTQIVDVGDRVEMECIVAGTPLPTIRWSRDDGPLPASSILGDGILIIPDARLEDAGTYTCTATNQVGSVRSKVLLYVKARPLISVPQDSMAAALGERASLSCLAHGYPSPEITWYRKDGQMPSEYTIVDGDLQIPRVRPEDAGTYICNAQNQYGQSDMAVDLRVEDLVPHFQQSPSSFISYEPLNDVYLDFDLLVSLKPESTEGMVMYNGPFSDGGGDFVCFGLNEGFPEFRFDVGSGPAVIRGDNKLGLNQWHTVKLSRDRQKGTMVVNDEPAYSGASPGKFQGLDILENMYLGGVPDFNSVPRAAGFRSGFVGSISEVQIKGINLNLGAEALEVVGINQYSVCQNSPCLNQGTCIPKNSRYGYECLCRQGFAGTRCETTGESCYPGACGPAGRCYTLTGTRGFRCVCPLGKTGAGCQVDVAINNPFFNRTSFISYPVIDNALFSLSIYLEFKPYSLEDGILLYDGNTRDGSGDFMSLILKDGYLEFRFDTGYGPAIIRSRYPIRVNEWTRVFASRRNRKGTLTINDEEPVTESAWSFSNNNNLRNNYLNYYRYKYKRFRRGTSPGATVGLNLKLPLFLGGVDPAIQVSSSAGTSQGFIGCVGELRVNDNNINLVRDALESANIRDCGESRLCERQPCNNGGVCEDLPGPDYRCLCKSTHTGINCDIEINICLTQAPCQNQAACSITDDGYRCDCPLGFMGKNCEAGVRLGTSIEVGGDGFVEFPKNLLLHSETQERETISFDIKTTELDGVIVWQGEMSGKQLRGGEYFSVGLIDGYIELSYELGSGPAHLRSAVRVNDGYSHSIEVSRLGRSGTLIVDGGAPVTGDSGGFLQMLNTKGNIFIGGVALVKEMTDNKFTENFNGCIENIFIQDKGPMRLPDDASSGYNVRPCVNK